MIFMLIVMFAPILSLPLFSVMRVSSALAFYIPIVIMSGWLHLTMHRCKHARPRNGLAAMLGEPAVVIKDLDPEGKVDFRGEIWNAITPGRNIPQGQGVIILGARGLQLIVKSMGSDASS